MSTLRSAEKRSFNRINKKKVPIIFVPLEIKGWKFFEKNRICENQIIKSFKGSKCQAPVFKIRQHSVDSRSCRFHLVHAWWWRENSWPYCKWKTAFGTGVNNHSLLTYTMEQSPWETSWFSGSQEIPHILWNPKVHYRIHNFPKLSV